MFLTYHSSHLRTLGGWMEYVDPETHNRFFYRNELVLKTAEDSQKSSGSRPSSPAKDNVSYGAVPARSAKK